MRTRNVLLVGAALVVAAGGVGAALVLRASAPRTGEVVVVAAFSEGSSSFSNETELAMPIENALAKLPGIQRLRSESRPNEVRATCFFEPGVDGLAATQAVQSALREVSAQLPVTASPPITTRGASDDRPLWAIGDARVRELLQVLPGVAQVEACGEMEDAVRVSLDPPRLAAVGLDLGSVLRELSASPFTRPAPDVTALSGTVLTSARASVPVRLSDVANIRVELRSTGCEATMLREREILARITVQSGANRKDVTKVVAEKVQSSGGRWLDPAGTIVLALGLPTGVEHSAGSALITKVAADLATVSGVTHVVAARHDARNSDVELVVTVDPPAAKRLVPELRTRVITSWPGVAWRGTRVSPQATPSVLTVTLKGPELEALEVRGREVKRRFASVAGVGPEIGVDLHSAPFLHVEIDRGEASRAGVRASDIQEVIRAATTGVVVGPHLTVFLGDERPGDGPLSSLQQVTVGKFPLTSLVRVSAETQAPLILRVDRQRAIELQWELEPAFSKRAAEAALADMNASVEVSSR
ncbi:MAG: cobalt-zinc-cadmium resistance protein CzcA [Myxococcaceae bacterium]|nr:cobalt-zinc-cadmium resistance protein CzcA [Myxococcaceae bacterium]